MAEQNQETVPVPVNLPLKRKRGRPQKVQAATNSSLGIQVTPNQVDLAAFSGMSPQTLPFHTLPKIDFDPTVHSRSVCFAHHSEVNPTQPNSAAASSQKTNGLLGQSVCGTLDGTFEAGYLLTVKVASTDHVLKGIVFDPLRCAPISEENDIAPLIPMARPIGNLHLAVEKPSQALISVPVRPASSSFDAVLPVQRNIPPSDSKSANQLLTPPNLPLSVANNSSVLNTNEAIPKVTESAPQNAAVDESQAETFLANKENPQMTSAVRSDDRSKNVIEPHGAESSANINTVEISGPNQRQHPFEDLLHGSVPQHCEQASDRGQSCRALKLQDELRNP
ncbi:uncharacterized protein LOC121988633 [Zingiber officinale]|uniref:uncharacterized protein LOC121988633 n=1 Tax=Zingiber officinale TaxID=94328 RepID=UPI001C4D5ED1|nr:uncharacterized protein LOC121988633 [Zingiber officinale]